MNVDIRRDLYRYVGDYSFLLLVKTFLSKPAFRFLVAFRICKRTSIVNPMGLFFRLHFRILAVRFGFQIPFETSIGGGLHMGHFGNIIVNQKAVLGRNCNISQGVTIGIVNRGERAGCPVIGDRVWIGANAVIIGNVKIGNDVLIAPLSYVIEDIPDKAVVMGNPAKIVNYNGSRGYVNNLLE